MKLDTKQLYPLQKVLDARIFDLHNVTRESTRDARFLALLVELSEFVNETKCFKYWSLKPMSAREVILEEFGDGIHFLLSLGIDLNDESEYIESIDKDVDLTDAVLEIYSLVNEFRNNFTKENYLKVFSHYLNAARILGFSSTDIEEYYLLKNSKNHARQDQGY